MERIKAVGDGTDYWHQYSHAIPVVCSTLATATKSLAFSCIPEAQYARFPPQVGSVEVHSPSQGSTNLSGPGILPIPFMLYPRKL